MAQFKLHSMVSTRHFVLLGALFFLFFFVLVLYSQTGGNERDLDCSHWMRADEKTPWPSQIIERIVVQKEEKTAEKWEEFEVVNSSNLTVANNVIDQPCRRNTGILVQRMRDTQRQINSFFRSSVTNITQRWELLPQVFGAAMNGFRYALKPFKFYSQDEFKHFLEFSNPRSECNHITLGVGGSWDGEKALRGKYPQCRLTGVDPVEGLSRDVVESEPNSRFILAAVSDVGGDQKALIKNENYAYATKKKIPHRAFTELLMNENEGRVVDFMTMDVEGAEFVLLRDLHQKRAELPVICQFNVEIHYKPTGRYNVSWEEFDRTLFDMFDDAHFIVLNVDERTFKYRRLFMFNIGDDECITKFLC